MEHKSDTPKSVTMRDVAKLAGVSQSTVSRVLNGSSESKVPISEETAQKIRAAIKQLGYQPNLAARSLRGQKTLLIAMMIADICNPYYQLMVRKVQDVARQHNYDVLITNSDHDPEYEHHFLKGIMRRPVDGVIITPYHLTTHDIEWLMQRTGVSVVALGQHVNHPNVDTIYADDERATYETTQWLIQQRGHRRIGFIGVPQTKPGERRWRGFVRAMKEAALPIPADYVKSGDFDVDTGERTTRELLQLREPPSAVFACNDLIALGCLTTAQAMRFKVPEDLAIVGFDNIPEAMRVKPGLTTVAQFPSEMGERMAVSLFERIDGIETGPGRRFEVPCRLIVRESG